jgi:hypothetical protein
MKCFKTHSTPASPFWQGRLLKLTKKIAKYLKKHCPDSKYEQLFFKYFPIHTGDFEKMCVDDVVCSSLGVNELNGNCIF